MEPEVKKDVRARSRLYPRYDLEDSIKFIEVVSKLGGSKVSSEAVGAEIGKAVNNSTFIGRISSSKQFGLLIQESGKLSLSSTSKEILFPRDDEERVAAIKTAFSTPTLYRELIDSFKGKTIPEQGALGNRLMHDYQIEAAAKDSAARNFIRSAQYANVLQNGILVYSGEQPSDTAQDKEVAQKKAPASDPFNFFFEPQKAQSSVFNDSGTGWTIAIKSAKSLNSEVRKKLIDVAELLEGINGQDA